MTSQISLFDHESERRTRENPPDQKLEAIVIPKDLPGARLPDLLPADAQLTLTKNYGVRADVLSRILRILAEKEAAGETVTRDEIGAELAIPSERRQGAFMVARRAELLTAENRLTPFAQLVVRHQPYLLDSGLLCVFHYLLASNANLVIWSHLFNSIFIEHDDIEPNHAQTLFAALSDRWTQNTIRDKARRELGGILRTYADEWFKPLGLITRIAKGHYSPNSNSVHVPSLVWYSTLLIYRDRYYSNAPSLETRLILNAPFSPGRILRQSEAAVRRGLDELHNAGLLTVETRSGLDQVRFKSSFTWLSAVAGYLQGQGMP